MPLRRTVAGFTAALLAIALAPLAFAAPAAAAENCDLGGFEIDGDTIELNCADPNDDFDNVDAATTTGGGTYTAASKDVDDPSTWALGGSSPDKADIDTLYTFTRVGDDGHYYLYVGWTRSSGTGTGKYALDLTFAESNVVGGAPQPDHSNGGMVAYIQFQGADLPDLEQICPYASQATYPDDVNSDPGCTTSEDGFASAISDDGIFFEAGFDLTEIADIVPSCPPSEDAATFYLRSITGGSGDGNLKAFADPLEVDPPSTCGFLEITQESFGDLALDDPTQFPYTILNGGDTVDDGDLQIGETDEYFTFPAGDAYSLTETIPTDAPWILWTIICTLDGQEVTLVDDGVVDEEATFSLAEGETTSCVITNATSFVEIVKQTLPDGDPTEFAFDVDGDDSNLSDGESVIVQRAPDTEVVATETVPDGWTLDSATCDPVEAGERDGDTLTITSPFASTVTCTFTNVKDATLIIEKELVGEVDATFNYTSTALGPFSIETVDQFGSETFEGLEPGTPVSVTETPKAGYETTDLVCDTESGIVIDEETWTVTVTPEPGAVITCTYTNSANPGELTVTKSAVGGNGTFAFTLTRLDGGAGPWVEEVTTVGGTGEALFEDIVAGYAYSIAETGLPTGWTSGALTCELTPAEGDSFSINPTEFYVAPGDEIACEITNTKAALPATGSSPLLALWVMLTLLGVGGAAALAASRMRKQQA